VKHDSDETSIVRCIICGETLDGAESVRYVGAVAHASCAAKSVENQFEGFDRSFFYIGSTGLLVALATYIPLYSLGISSRLYALAFVGIAIGLVLQSVGFLGIQRNYHMPRANVPYFLALITAALYSGAAVLLIVFGNDPLYYHESGAFLVMSIPMMVTFLSAAFLMTGFLMVMVAVVIFMLEGTISDGIANRIIGILLFVLVAFLVDNPLNIMIEFVLVSFVFLTARPPKDWSEVSELELRAS